MGSALTLRSPVWLETNTRLKKRLKQLDALRAVAVLLVLGCHVTWHPLWVRCGWTGVDLFFVLSGFLIAGLLFREYKSHNRIHLCRFIERRALKIYPAYYVLLIATVAYELLRGGRLLWSTIWPDLLFVQNYRIGMWPHLWSLGTEEQFYLLLPFALVLLTLRKQAAPFECIPAASLSIMGICLLSRVLWAFSTHHPSSWFPGCIRGIDGLALGVMISYFHEFEPQKLDWVSHERLPLLLISLLCLLPAIAYPFEHRFMQTIGLTLLYVGYAGLLLFYLRFVHSEGKVIGAFAFVGSYSYTIYLFHMPVADHFVSGLAPYVGRTSLFALYVALSITLGIVVAKLVERPVLRIRERLLPSRI
ncbi:putative acyltransferase [Candidatus Sulfopaludibacter sp. SbA4]|nr:putative acyltransferase [Candidatus Sulfopaludibacter sp. SbA4]